MTTNMGAQFHGSDLELIAEKYHIKKDEIINFSGNVNPLGLSQTIKDKLSKKIDLIAAYPDREYTSLRETISKYINVNKNHILVGNGSTELISLFIKLVAPTNATIIGPTYSEYEREIFIGGGSSRYYPLSEKDGFKVNVNDLKKYLNFDTDLLVICNPNNPTSTAIYSKELRQILDYCKEQDIFVLIDETYVEFCEDINNVSAAKFTEFYSNLFIIRGVSKFFAAPGLRLGYGVCGNEDIIRKINNLKNPWTINSLAAYAGELMLSDHDYILKTKALIRSERNRIIQEMNSWDTVHIFPPTANFILVKILTDVTSQDVFEELISNKMMIRDASSFPFLNAKYFRFCILEPKNNTKLLEALKSIIIEQK